MATQTPSSLAGQKCDMCFTGVYEVAVLAGGFERKVSCSVCGFDPINDHIKPQPEVSAHILFEEGEPQAQAIMKEYTNPVACRLLDLADLAEAKGREYGETHDKYGPVMKALFPEGIHAVSPEDWNRLGVLNMIVHKLMRYAANMKNGGHLDSANDLSVYGAILAEVTKQ